MKLTNYTLCPNQDWYTYLGTVLWKLAISWQFKRWDYNTTDLCSTEDDLYPKSPICACYLSVNLFFTYTYIDFLS